MSDLPAILIAGPTASGKSALALALCERFGDCFEIVSVDSAQVYRGMDIGTAKPTVEIRHRVPHHLLDVVDPAERYSAARFAEDARAAMADIRSRGRRPLLVGGTMLYFRALMQGLSPLPGADPALRRQLVEEAEREGWPALHERLAKIDPPSAARIHPNDAQRIQRALEIYARSGESPSRLYQQARPAGSDENWLAFAIVPPARAELHARIEARFDAMLEQGFVEEVRALHARVDLQPGLPSVRAVGYRQLWGYLDGQYDFDEARQKALAATRQYAKRQYTWLRSEPAFQHLPQTGALEFLVTQSDLVSGT